MQNSIPRKILPNMMEIYKGMHLLFLIDKYKSHSTIPFDPVSMRVLEFRNQNVKLPQDDDTLYWCKIFKLPSDIRTKHHIIRVSILEIFSGTATCFYIIII